MRHELIHLSEHTNPDYPYPVYLVQYAVDGKKCPPFWSTKKARIDMGEDAWFESLKLEAEAAIAENGPCHFALN